MNRSVPVILTHAVGHGSDWDPETLLRRCPFCKASDDMFCAVLFMISRVSVIGRHNAAFGLYVLNLTHAIGRTLAYTCCTGLLTLA